MAVKLSSYYCFRNNYLMRSIEDKYSAAHWFGKELLPKDKKTLEGIIKELDALKDGSHFKEGKPEINSKVVVLNVVELKDITEDPAQAAKYLKGIFDILKRYWVKVEMYRRLGQCFDEMGIMLKHNADIAKAIKYANNKINSERYSCNSGMCWKNIKKYKQTEAAPF